MAMSLRLLLVSADRVTFQGSKRSFTENIFPPLCVILV
jgi:hypothetical protein